MRTFFSFLSEGDRRWQRVVGLMCLAAGFMLLCQPFARAADDSWWQNPDSSVRSEVSDLAMFGKRLSASQPMQSFAVADLKPGAGPVVPARLRIPAIQVDASIENLGLRNGNMDVPSNIWNAGWLHSSPRPGDAGNAVIDGHKDSVSGVAVFWDLGKLKVGDRIYVSDQYGYELTFEVFDFQSYDKNSAPLGRIFGSTSEKQLNLITCDGTFVPEQYTYDKRLVVYTRLVNTN